MTNSSSPQGVSVHQFLSVVNQDIVVLEQAVIADVQTQLDDLRVQGKLDRHQHAAAHDNAFRAINDCTIPLWKMQMHWRGIGLWLVHALPIAETFQAKWNVTLHKGAPMYNTGLLFFMAGDYARAMQYISEAGNEDRLSGRTTQLHLGQGLAAQMLVDPLVAWLTHEIGRDYLAATGESFSKTALHTVVDALGRRDEDGMTFLAGIHRLVSQLEGPQNHACQLHRVRGLADVILAYESSLRRWQAVQGELAARSIALFKLRPGGTRAWGGVESRHSNRKNTAALNQVLIALSKEFDTANTKMERAAIACFATYALRNSLMHSIDPKLLLFQHVALLKRVLGFAIIACRLSVAAEVNDRVIF